jgi:hypothetical protein
LNHIKLSIDISLMTETEQDFYIFDDMVYFALKGRGQKNGLYASVSTSKWPLVSKYKWYLGKTGYPVCYELHKMQLHRFVFTHSFGQQLPSK